MILLSKGSFNLSFVILGVVLLSVNTHTTSGQVQPQCPTELLEVAPNGTITFSPLSEGSGPVDASYNAGAAGGWFALANGFVDAVRSGGLPFDLIIPVVNTTFIQPSGQGASFDPLTFLQSFASWWAGILAVTLLGCLLAISFCICGCCFWCCRCCGNCGGSKSQKPRDNNDCITFTFAIILLLFSFLLLAGVVLAFFSNEQTFRSVENLRSTLNDVTDNVVNYISDTIQEGYDVICQLSGDGGVVSSVIDRTQEINDELQTTIMSISNQVNDIIVSLNNTGLQEANEFVRNINSATAGVSNATNDLSASLTRVMSSLSSLDTNCAATSNSALTTLCVNVLPPIVTSVQNAQNAIPQLPDNSVTTTLQEALDTIGLQVMDGTNTLMNVLGPQVTSQLNSTVGGLLDNIAQYNASFFGIIDQVSAPINEVLNNTISPSDCPTLQEAFNNIQVPNFAISLSPSGGGGSTGSSPPSGGTMLTVGYVRECVVNSAFAYIKNFDVYRYAFGIIVCSLSLITIVLVWIGVLLGMIGFGKDRYPNDRSSVSHCGGICLLVSVGFTFLFGFFLLILSAIFFFFGANSLKLCQSLQGPEYDLFASTIDAPAIRSAISQVTGGAGGGTGSINFNDIPSISGLLRSCEENNTALYTAANLGAILSASGVLPSGSISGLIRTQLNLSTLQSEVDTAIQNAASSLNINPADYTSLIQGGVDMIRNLSLSNFNVSGYTTEIDMAIALVDINGTIEQLSNLSAQFQTLGDSSLQPDIDNIVVELENIRDNLIPNLQASVVKLDNQTSQITVIQSELLTNADQLVTMVTGILSNITGPVLDNFINVTVRGAVDQSFGYLDQYIDNLDYQIENTVGGCQPVYGVYTQLHNAVCRNFLDGLNGFWWSLGFCSLLYLPVIIFAVLTSAFFLKKKKDNAADDFQDFPMKSY